MHLFSLGNEGKELGFLKLMLMSDSIMGSPFICSTNNIDELFGDVKEAIKWLSSLDLIDDDQMWLAMINKMKPSFFEIHISNWFMPIKEYGGEHLSVKKIGDSKSLKHFMTSKTVLQQIKYVYVHLFLHTTVERFDYERRLKKMINNYHI